MLRTGCQWQALDQTELCTHSTAHDRFQEWVKIGVFLKLWQAGIEQFDEVHGLDWDWLSMDGAMVKAPLGGEKTGPHPTDRGKSGAKRSLLTEGHGVPIGLAIEGANRHDMKLVQPTIESIIVDRPKPSEEQPPGMAALWDVATPEERHEMVSILLEPEGFSYETELNMLAALKPRPAFLPILSLLQGVFEYKETSELLVTIHWSQRNRRATNHRSHLALIPMEKLFAHPDAILVYRQKSSAEDDPFEQALDNPVVVSLSQRHPGPNTPQWKVPISEWSNVVRRVVENQEPLRKVADDYSVSYETIRRIVRAASK